MNKRVAGGVLAGVIMIAISILFVKILQSAIHQDAINQSAVLPASLPLFNLDSIQYQVPDNGRMLLLIHFNSTCDHCQEEVKSMASHAAAFAHASIVFISSEPLYLIKQFKSQWALAQYKNIDVVKMNAEDLYNTFGSISFPCIYIYDADRRLVKVFKGETKAEALLQYL
ncbi:hypothetical protein [Ohtaekwangia sp.]|uniref:hypothetical protein n=1 Tax=Ohtaekwangia sp. TaxID=2066019 RepID=UPI002FDD9A71